MKTIQSLERAIEILFSFKKDKPTQTVEELARAAGIPRSSVYRFLLSLKKAGLVEQDSRTGRYALGLKLLELGEIVHSRLGLEDITIPYIKDLAGLCGETVQLTVPYNECGMCIYVEESSAPLRVAPERGQTLPLYAGASEQAILAFLPEEKQEDIRLGPLTAITPYTITDPEVLKTRLEKIREQGYIITRDEVYLGSVGIACPVFNRDNQVVASISVSAPSERMTPEKQQLIIRKLLEITREASRRLAVQ